MADGRFPLVVLLITTPVLVGGTLIVVSIRRSEPHRKWFYLLLMAYEFGWWGVLSKLLPLLSVPFAWQVGVNAVFVAVFPVTLVLLWRHRHDPDPEDM